MDLALRDHVIDHVRIGAGSVHHCPCLESTCGRCHLPVTVFQFFDFSNLGVAQEFGAVLRRVFGKSNGQLIGTNDAASTDQQGFLGFAPNVWFTTTQFFLVDDTQFAANAVLNALLQKLFKSRMIVQIEGDHKRRIPLHRYVQLFVELIKHGVAQHVELCFQSPGLCVVSAVNDGGVCFALSVANIVCFFQQEYLRRIARQLAGRSAAHHAAADNDHIIQFAHFMLSFINLLWPSQKHT